MGSSGALIVAELGKAHGIRGEIMARLSGVEPEDLKGVPLVLRRPDGSEANVTIQTVRSKNTGWILGIEGFENRTIAEDNRGSVLLAKREDLPELEEDEWYIDDLVGLEVLTDEGESLGRIEEVIQSPANDVFVVRGGPRGEVLLPVIGDVIRDVDLSKRRVAVTLLPGLVDDVPPAGES